MTATNLLRCLVFFVFSLALSQATATAATATAACRNVLLADCLKTIGQRHGVTVVLSIPTPALPVDLVLSGATAADDAQALCEHVNLTQISIMEEPAAKKLVINVLGPVPAAPSAAGGATAPAAAPDAPAAEASPLSDSVASPTPEEMEAQRMKQAAGPQPVDLDAKMSIPGFPDEEAMTMRQVLHNQEARRIDPNEFVVPGVPDEGNVRFKDLPATQARIYKAPDRDAPFEMPDGTKVIPREIQEADKRGAKALSPELPPGPASDPGPN